MEVSLVIQEHIESVWPKIEEYMHGAAKYTYGRFTKEQIHEGLYTKPQQLWIAFDKESNNKVYGAVITEMFQYPQMKVLVMHFTGGVKLMSWKKPMLELLQRFARDHGCSIIESYGRPGWEKVFKNDGYKKAAIFYELPVDN
jgi:hypothetical protein